MRKLLTKLCFTILSLGMAIPIKAEIGDYFSIDNFNFEITGQNPNTVKLVSGPGGEEEGFSILIPSVVIYEDSEYHVTSIGFCAFQQNNAEIIEIPESITKIEDLAFDSCNKLKNITIPNSVVEIGNRLFSFCENLQQVVLSDNLKTIGVQAFGGCQNLERVVLGGSIERIEDIAFSGCSSLATIECRSEIPPVIGDRTFEGLEKSNCNVIVPPGCYSVYKNSLDWGEFNYSDYEFIADSGDYTYSFEKESNTCEVINYNGTTGYLELQSEVTITTEEGNEVIYKVTGIGKEAFKGNQIIFNVKFPDTILKIGSGAFQDCEILNFENLPENLISIGDYAFSGCNSIKKIKIPESVEVLGEGCFSGMASLQRAILYSKVTELPYRCFFEDKRLEEVYLPNNLLKICSEAFAWDTLLEEIVLPSTLVELEDHAFIGGAPDRTGLKAIVFPPSVKKFGLAFRHTGIQSVDLGNVEEVTDGAFEACYELREVKFSPNIKRIGRSAFALCGANAGRTMSDIILPDSLEFLGESAFDGSNVMNLSIGDGVRNIPMRSCGAPTILTLGCNIDSIHPEAFDPYKIQIIKINTLYPPIVPGGFPLTPEEKRKISVVVANEEAKNLYKSHVYWEDFNIVCMDANTVEVNLDGSEDIASAIYNQSGIMPAEVTRLIISGHISDQDFVIIKENMISLLYLDMSNTDNTIIPSGAFQKRQAIETIVLPNNLKRIEDEAFIECISLDIPGIPDSVEYIGDSAFRSCERLTITKLPDELVYLGHVAFYLCASLKSMTFGPNLEEMGSSFQECEGLEYVDMSNATKLKTLPEGAFNTNYKLRTLILPDGLERIGGPFMASTLVKSIKLPGTLKEIGEEAFADTKLRVISLEEGIERLPDYVFRNNKKLITVNLPSTLSELGNNPFEGTEKVNAISCLAPEAPEASSSTFDYVNTRSCVLSVPKKSFYSYLSAPGWGMFSNIENTLEINIPSDIEITTIPEEDYEDLVAQEEYEDHLQSVNNGQFEVEEQNYISKRQVNLSFLAEDMPDSSLATSKEILDGSLFCKLKHGSVMASEEDNNKKGHRIFIKSVNGEPIKSVKINGVEMIDQLDEKNSLILPTGSFGELVVNDGNQSQEDDSNGVESILGNPDMEPMNVYDINGKVIFVNATLEQIKNLNKGLYIINGKKIVVR